jgi:hypothetical protein
MILKLVIKVMQLAYREALLSTRLLKEAQVLERAQTRNQALQKSEAEPR